jgi:hypothetical protein
MGLKHLPLISILTGITFGGKNLMEGWGLKKNVMIWLAHLVEAKALNMMEAS